jgi:energy-coupling factor transport system permease protein
MRGGFDSLDPRAKLLAALVLMLPLLLAPSPRAVAVSAAALLLGVSISGHARSILHSLIPIAWLGLGLVVFTALVEPVGRVWLLGVLPFSPVGAGQGALLAARMLVLVGIGLLLAATTPPQRLAAGVEWLLQPLRVLKLDVQSFSLALMLVLRFVPLFHRELATTERAMLLRGARFGRGPIQQVRRLAVLAVPAVGRLMVASEDLAAALVSRGYGLSPLLAAAGLHFGRGDALLLAAAVALAAVSLLR